MDRFSNKKAEISSEVLARTVWVSISMAMILSLPPLGLFLGIYFTTGNLIIGALIGFGIHFVFLALSSKISKYLTKIVS
jgi:hypothetical protein